MAFCFLVWFLYCLRYKITVKMYQSMAQTKIRLAIFDLDGTLLDTIADLGHACNFALESCGCPPREMSEYNMLVGKGIYNLFRSALPETMRTEEMVMKMKGFFIPYYNMHKTDYTRPYPGIPEMLERVEKAGVALAVASNKYQEGTEALVKRFFGERKFVKILGQRDGMPIKPDPGIVREIEDACGNISPDEVLYAGDSDVDMETGRNAGVLTAGVLWGFRSREELQAWNPHALCGSPEELGDIILDRTTI